MYNWALSSTVTSVTNVKQCKAAGQIWWAWYYSFMTSAQITQAAQAVNDAICEAIDECRAFDWLPNFGYYQDNSRRYSMWA